MTKAAAILRGYGARAWFVWQGKGQPDELYGKNAETFFSNAGQTQMFAINDVAGAEYAAERIGKWVRWAKKKSRDGNGREQVEMEPTASVFLRDGPEVNRTTGRAGGLQIVFNEGGDPFLLRRTSYRKMFKPGEYDPNPYEPQQPHLGDKAMESVRRIVMKIKEWRQ